MKLNQLLSVLCLLIAQFAVYAQAEKQAKETPKSQPKPPELLKKITKEEPLSQADQAFAKEIKRVNVIPQLQQVAKGTYDKKQYRRHLMVMERLVELRPLNATWKFNLARAYALLDKKSEAYNTLIELQNAGLSYPIGDAEGFDLIKGTGVFDYIEKGMQDNGDQYGEGEVVHKVNKGYSGMLFQSMAFDEQNNRFLLPSVRSGDIYQVDANGKLSVFVDANEAQDFGAVDIVIDNKNAVFWVASATMPQYNGTTQENFGSAKINKYRLSDGKLLTEVDLSNLAKPLLLNNFTLMSSGDVIAFNPFTKELFKFSKDGKTNEVFATLPQFNAIQAIAIDDEDQVLYLADYDLGIVLLNLENKKMIPLVDSPKVNLSGVEELFYDDGDLIVIQSGVQPQRVLRVILQQKAGFKSMVPLEANNPNFAALSKGALGKDDVYYFANNQWSKMDLAGNLLPDEQWQDLIIMKTPLRYNLEKHLEMQQQIEDFKKKKGLK